MEERSVEVVEVLEHQVKALGLSLGSLRRQGAVGRRDPVRYTF